MMKILFLRQYNIFAETGAASNRFRSLIEGLRSLGHTVDLVVVGGFVSQKEKSVHEKGVYYLSGANHYSYLSSRLNTYLFDGLRRQSVSRKLKRLISLSSYDIIWLTNSHPVFSVFQNISTSAKTFMELNEFYDISKEKGQVGNMLQRIQGLKSRECFEKMVKKIDCFGVMTKTLLDYYRPMARPDAQFLHLPMTVDLSRFKNVEADVAYKKPYIAFMGTMNNLKDGVDILIKAFALISDYYPEVSLYLAGFWHYDVPSQDQLIKCYGLESRIHRIGVLPREQIPPFICNASILALPRPDSHQARGGFPTKLGEYLATGKPVCVTKVGEIPDYLEDNVSAFMAHPGDVDSFADAMSRALYDVKNAIFVGEKGRQIAQTVFNADVQVPRLAAFLEMNVN